MPSVKLMPTGGVTINNVGDWITAGAVAVGIGTSLLDARAIADGRFDVIVQNGRTIVANVRRARGRT
jgi:2-dehydro-3-deoxyphosphogluconate aldolase/(4S)-4-hydroxy-2-oxoglutarate aldolase